LAIGYPAIGYSLTSIRREFPIKGMFEKDTAMATFLDAKLAEGVLYTMYYRGNHVSSRPCIEVTKDGATSKGGSKALIPVGSEKGKGLP
jgi:hypothetical protein